MNIEPFLEEHVEPAAELLATSHRRDLERQPDTPGHFDDLEVTVPRLCNLCARGSGVVALNDSEVVGYLLGVRLPADVPQMARRLPARTTMVGPLSSATRSDTYETYRAMYAGAAPMWLADGSFDHIISLPAGDAVAVEAWFSLGFGHVASDVVLELSPATGDAQEFDVRRAGTEDLAVVASLVAGVAHHEALSPNFTPAVIDWDAMRGQVEHQLAEGTNAYWIAYQADAPVAVMGFVVAQGDLFLNYAFAEESARGAGVGTALLNRGLDWARAEGHRRCFTSYGTANLSAAAFWPGKGFRPVRCSVRRHIDERISWAS